MGTVIHFEITSDSIDATTSFLADALGWESSESPFVPDYAMLSTGDGTGIDGAVMSRTYQFQPVIVWVSVDDIDSSIASVIAAGGSVLGEVQEIAGARLVYIADPSGTLFGLRQII